MGGSYGRFVCTAWMRIIIIIIIIIIMVIIFDPSSCVDNDKSRKRWNLQYSKEFAPMFGGVA
jgi:uncharacterized membrane protein